MRKRSKKLLFVLSIAIVMFILGFGSGLRIDKIEISCKETPKPALEIESAQQSHMLLPAINTNDTGVAASLDVYVKPGDGLVLININNVLADTDVEQAARTAVYVSSEYTKQDLGKVDIIYDLRANASYLEGPSGGVGFTIATIAALENKELNKNVMITGVINHDGTIGPSAKILEKARAAKEVGADTFLVPIGVAKDVNYAETEFCHKWGGYEYCQPEYIPSVTDISKDVGIRVVEVKNIEEALSYFLE